MDTFATEASTAGGWIWYLKETNSIVVPSCAFFFHRKDYVVHAQRI
jgi:hypothetical protein